MEVQDKSRPRLRLRVDRVVKLTERIKAFELSAAEGALPRFEAGAHIDVLTGAGAARSYSLAHDPAEIGRYMIAVLREPEGIGSGWMHEDVSAGDVLDVLAPRNAFRLDETAAEHLLIAGGIGITPFVSMIPELRRRRSEFEIHYCTRSPERTAFRRNH